jgi:hemoglobin/transferrin/lactoferrin receptor protein
MSHPPRGAVVSARAIRSPIHLVGVSAIALVVALPQPAAAQNLTEAQATILERFVLTATRSTKNVLDVPQNVAVIDAETIEKHQVRDIQDLVRYEPGIAVTRTSSVANPGAQLNSFTIRGVSGNRVQMLVDGSRIQESVIDGSRDFVDPWNVKAVELLRGPNSVLWGADALGGTVAFRTKDPSDLLEGSDKPWAVEIKTSYDSFDHIFRKQVTGAYDFGDLEVLGSFGNLTATEPALSNADPDGGVWGKCPRPSWFRCDEFFPQEINAYNGLLKAVWTPSDAHKFTATWEFNDRNTAIDQIWDSSANTGTGNSFYLSEDYQREIDMERQHFALDHEWQIDAPWLDSVKWTLSYAPQSRDLHSEQTRYYSQATPSPYYRYITTDRDYSETFLEADLQLVSSFDAGPTSHKLTYGFDGDIMQSHYYGVTFTDYSNSTPDTTAINQGFAFPDVETSRADLYIQDEIEMLDGRLTVTPGLRWATYNLSPGTPLNSVPIDDIGSEALIKKLSALYKIDDSWSAYAAYGEGFKMPTAQQLYYTSAGVGFEVVPNPDLRPESVKSYEAGVRGEFERGWFSVNGYYAHYDDYIQTLQEVSPGVYTSLNVDTVNTWGIEASAEWEAVDNVFLTGSLTWSGGTQQKTDADPETVFDGAIPLTTVLGLRYELPDNGLEFEVFGTFAQGVKERSDPNAFKPEGYAVFDAYAKYKPTENVELSAGIQNIFDTRYFPNTLTGYANTATDSVAAQNPLELQVAPGRTFKVGATVKF